jgi:hypothetical protein
MDAVEGVQARQRPPLLPAHAHCILEPAGFPISVGTRTPPDLIGLAEFLCKLAELASPLRAEAAERGFLHPVCDGAVLSRKPGREPAADRVGMLGMAPFGYPRHRFLPEIIQHAIWLYLRFILSYRDVEEPLADRGRHQQTKML